MRATAPKRRISASPGIRTWCRRVRSTSGTPIPSRPSSATASSMGAAPPTWNPRSPASWSPSSSSSPSARRTRAPSPSSLPRTRKAHRWTAPRAWSSGWRRAAKPSTTASSASRPPRRRWATRCALAGAARWPRASPCAAWKVTSPIRSRWRIRSTSSRPLSPSSRRPNGIAATRLSRRPASRSPTSAPAPAWRTSCRASRSWSATSASPPWAPTGRCARGSKTCCASTSSTTASPGPSAASRFSASGAGS